ncbi:ABC-2 family transporter protein [Micromonospora coriariae]|uniref:ABC-2 family transporter protein n=1 Tax=Micromonospora coriariae TaxID=285665 RepID=A0A1C4UJ96_9ACTN|nr:transporter [Micromonospora coriariae]SCE71701.1 ABC-2 family transporter protein [Micromonospora coriariae]
MIWLTWRQHRKQVLFTLLGFAALAALMVPIGLSMRSSFADLGLPECVRQLSDPNLAAATREGCDAAFHRFSTRYGSLNLLAVLLITLPVLVGLFWGAPLVAREVEHGTHRFVWTQGVGRTRWALVKFGLVGAGGVVLAVGYGLGISWWVEPLTQATHEGRLGMIVFDLQGIVPIGYTLFAVALGVFAGTVWKGVLPAMGITLAGFVGVRAAVEILARPHYQPARTKTFPIEAEGPPVTSWGDWILTQGVRNPDGTMIAEDTRIQCPPGGKGPDGRTCGAELGLEPGAYNWQLYQPADRFWLFQGIETGIFVALALLLLYLAVRRIRRIA